MQAAASSSSRSESLPTKTQSIFQSSTSYILISHVSVHTYHFLGSLSSRVIKGTRRLMNGWTWTDMPPYYQEQDKQLGKKLHESS
ncbi:hypothetical protein MLD38_009771 [Melastoma candidum]|uniref:Uncharacterized protein n=1 Tax=Melastoma candidum TaxID=119954 RepID=A0ACB9S0I8_9MYRT|nr:hypothetical protein MLD38_009771 [Melastoma candidum]